ncbi:MAG: hypothetical protein IKT41_03765 [Clostridia bacterium]|nr:hypothetical protein [Clostridia bacterium]
MKNSEMIQILSAILAVFIIILFILVVIAITKSIMKKKAEKKKEETKETIDKKLAKTNQAIFRKYTRESIYDFMEFDKVEDDMIIQKNGNRFLMVVECQGVNYDLMSQVEKVAVEEGFLQLLNSLRHPIQLYIQTKTVNLNNSIAQYRKRQEENEEKLRKMNIEYELMMENSKISQEQLNKYRFEVIKQNNLCEYGEDIINNTEHLNLNKNVLTKKYYIIIPYYSEEAQNPDLDKEEILNIAFSELYTRAQSIIRMLYMCDVKAKVLDSMELIDLLYVAYNRDESEIYEIEKAVQSGCEDIYSVAQDVYEKKIKALNKEIEHKARVKAEEKLEEAKTNKQKRVENIIENYDQLLDEMAKMIIEENIKYIDKDIAEEAIENITKEAEKKKRGRKKKEGNE